MKDRVVGGGVVWLGGQTVRDGASNATYFRRFYFKMHAASHYYTCAEYLHMHMAY